MRNVLPAFGSTVGSVLSAPGLRNAVLSGVQRALRATLDPAARGVVMYAHEWMRDLPQEAWKARYTHTRCGDFPQADYPRVLAEYFAFCKSYYKQQSLPLQRGQRREPPAPGPQLAVQRELRRPHVHPRAFLDRRPGWADFLIDFNDFASPWAASRPSIKRAR
jgi:hypothetical protein